MNNRAVSLAFLFLSLTLPLFARNKTDLLVMKNGDHMTCEVKGLDSGILYVSFDYIDGTTSVDWSKVARLESKQSFIVKTQDGTVYTGLIRTADTSAGRPVRIEVVENDAHEVELERSKIISMTGTSDKFWERFNGQINFGINYSKGNQSTQFSLGSQTAYVRERWNAGVSFDSNLASSTGANTSTRNSLSGTATRLLRKNNWFYAGVGDLLQSSEQGISHQSGLGGGVGRYLKNTDRASIAVLGGLVWQSTTYNQPNVSTNTQNITGALLYTDIRFFRFSKTNFSFNGALIPALSEPGRIYFNTNASYYVKLFSNLKWNASFYGNWDSRPPAGLSGSDYGTTSGLSWTFGLK
ncbi:MAG: DUF481 domain-containing protein [Terracidiphilus sp.]